MSPAISYVVQADDTNLPVQDRRKAKNIKRGRLLALVGDDFYESARGMSDGGEGDEAEMLG